MVTWPALVYTNLALGSFSLRVWVSTVCYNEHTFSLPCDCVSLAVPPHQCVTRKCMYFSLRLSPARLQQAAGREGKVQGSRTVGDSSCFSSQCHLQDSSPCSDVQRDTFMDIPATRWHRVRRAGIQSPSTVPWFMEFK